MSFAQRFFSQSARRLQKTPFQVFKETFKNELKKSKELQTNIKALQDETGRLSESTAFKRAKEALEASKSAKSATSKTIAKASDAVGTAAAKTWNSTPVKLTRTAMSTAADQIDKSTLPIRQTKVFQEVKNTLDDGASIRYGGFESAEKRKLRRQRELARQQQLHPQPKVVKANPDSGTNVVKHAFAEPDKPAKESKFAHIKEQFEESDNALVTLIRNTKDFVSSFFAETEQARVIKAFKTIDPSFTQDAFLRELRAYILPEVLDAYVRGDSKVLKTWMSEASFNVWNQITKEYRDKGLYAAGRVLDVRGVDIVQAKIRESDGHPLYVVSCRAQETNFYKSLKTEEVVAGVPDQVLLSPYVMVITRIPEELENEETRGWKILEFVRGRSNQYH